jgi:hypothetical protein
MNHDVEHLRLLSIFHYIVATITAITSFFALILVTVVAMMTPYAWAIVHGSDGASFLYWNFDAIGGAVVLSGWALAIAMVFAGRYLKQHRKRTFCLVVAAISCIVIPFGTVLGIFTIVVHKRPSAIRLFGVNNEIELLMR